METAHLCLILTLCLLVHRSSSDILQRQKRNWIIDSFTIDEGYKGEYPYVLGKITLERQFTLFQIKGQGVDEEPKRTLQINNRTGEITVLRPVDYEKFKVIKLTFQAYNEKKQMVDTRLGIEIVVKDANDNAPKFDRDRYEVTIMESTKQETEIITFKATDDDSSEGNGKFDFRIVSVTPAPHDLEFSLVSIQEQTGSLTFKGCLDHEKAEKYTVIVEAKDRGADIQFSSSCTIVINIEDGNNHMPVITGETRLREVKEREANVLVSRVHVTDEDTEGTPAWRAKYHIHGDKNNNFNISTDPETNDGLLYVIKPLDFEDSPMKNLTITVENDIPYQLCKVVNRHYSGSWEVAITQGVSASHAFTSGMGSTVMLEQSIRRVSVRVIDVNDPPSFLESIKKVKMGENRDMGQHLATFTAKDSDVAAASTIVYKLGDDPAGWVTVDSVTGKVTTAKSLDRESSYVKDNVYAITVLAIDDGVPQMTSTATLSIFIIDENDSDPVLSISRFDMCRTDSVSMVNITVSDLDDDPYGGPFHFKLRGDVENKWRVEPDQGYSVNLVKESSVHSGQFELLLEVSDRQHKTTVHNVSVTVCSCLDPTRPNCRFGRETYSGGGVGVLWPILFSFLLFGVAFLLLLWLSCKEEKKIIEIDGSSSQQMIKSYTEAPGTDCDVAFGILNKGKTTIVKSLIQKQLPTQVPTGSIGEWSKTKSMWGNSSTSMAVSTANQMTQEQYQQFTRERMNQASWRTSASSSMRVGYQGSSMHRGFTAKRKDVQRCSAGAEANQTILKDALTLMLCKRQEDEAKLGSDPPPFVYATEEDQEARSELSMLDIPAEPDLELDLHQDQYAQFTTLASICMRSEHAAYNAKTACAENHEWKVKNYHWHETEDLKYRTSDFKCEQVHSTYISSGYRKIDAKPDMGVGF